MILDEEQMWPNITPTEAIDLAWEEQDEASETETPSTEVLTYHTSRDISQAHSALLDMITVSQHTNPDAYRLVRAHLVTLERWHEQNTGWRIQRGSAFFRLERHPHGITPVYLDDKLKRTRDFVCLAWLLWFAEKRHLAGGAEINSSCSRNWLTSYSSNQKRWSAGKRWIFAISRTVIACGVRWTI
jgi:hypothetical protein